MSSCNGNCSECGSDCADRKPESLLAELNPNASVKKVIAVVSGKGGVGKSTVTSMLAVAMARKGKRPTSPAPPHPPRSASRSVRARTNTACTRR